MDRVGIRELSHHTSRYVARVKAGTPLEITEHGTVVAVLSPAVASKERPKPRPKIGGYRSEGPLTAAEIDSELAHGFGNDDDR